VLLSVKSLGRDGRVCFECELAIDKPDSSGWSSLPTATSNLLKSYYARSCWLRSTKRQTEGGSFLPRR
jgi:hypothetical protein